MKSIGELRNFVSQYNIGGVIPYQDFDEFCGISGLNWFERQQKRIQIAKRINTNLRRGGLVIDDKIHYCALWVADRGRNRAVPESDSCSDFKARGSFVLIDIGDSLLKDSERSFKSAAQGTDNIIRALSKAIGEEEYESKVEGRVIEFRGPKPILSPDLERSVKAHLSTLRLFAPTINTMLGVADQARSFYEENFGPLRLADESQSKAA